MARYSLRWGCLRLNHAVDYLNSLHNASAANENALAENQLANPFYNMLQVKRSLASHISEMVSKRNSTILLTGHAGDGKTALLFQVLDELSTEPLPSRIHECGILSLNGTDRKLLYVKDMSELPHDCQEALLLKALKAPSEGHSSILVSNTGPLLNTFSRIRKQIDPDLSETVLQMRLLDALDKNNGSNIEIGSFSPIVFNMARMDSVPLSLALLDKLLSDELWKPCHLCEKANMCPIYGNRNDLVRNRDKVWQFIEAYLRWLNETDNRLTIRQVLAQLAYGITSGLSCRDIQYADVHVVRFKHSFANAFWGYRGIETAPEAEQLHGVRAIRALELDSKSLDADYAMFVQGDFSMFDEPIRQYLIANSDPLKIGRQDSAALRSAFRRFYCLFATRNEHQTDTLFQALFSPVFPIYMRSRKGLLSRSEESRLKTMVFRALYRLFVGFLPSSEEKTLYLAIRRPGDGFASAQLLYGEVAWTEFDIKAVPTQAFTEDERWNELQLQFKGKELSPYPISLPLLDYFHRLSEGAVATRLNPSLSHGLDRLRSSLVSHFKYQDQQCIRVLIRTAKSTRIAEMVVDGEHLVVS